MPFTSSKTKLKIYELYLFELDTVYKDVLDLPSQNELDPV